MKAAFIVLFSSVCWLTACSQQDARPDSVRLHSFPVGRSAVMVEEVLPIDTLPFLLVHLHGNESTAAAVAETFVASHGLSLVRICNEGERLVSFQQNGNLLRFDPNRIFSDSGIQKTLALHNTEITGAWSSVQQFRDTLLQLLDRQKIVIALHNNTDLRLSILQYREAGTMRTHVNAIQDADDFFLTNDAAIFEQLKAADFNVVLEDASLVEEDGSLSLYSSRENIRYINIEAEHGHYRQQSEMLALLLRIIH